MVSKRKDLEKEFQNWLIKKKKIRVKKNLLSVIHTEYPLMKPMHVLSQGDWRFEKISYKGVIGRIDLIIRFRGKEYVSEIKYTPFAVENFWSAVKCLAYCVYYNWQRELEHKIIAGKLGITIFGIQKEKDNWIVEAVNIN